jgi:hypothetical protein
VRKGASQFIASADQNQRFAHTRFSTGFHSVLRLPPTSSSCIAASDALRRSSTLEVELAAAALAAPVAAAGCARHVSANTPGASRTKPPSREIVECADAVADARSFVFVQSLSPRVCVRSMISARLSPAIHSIQSQPCHPFHSVSALPSIPFSLSPAIHSIQAQPCRFASPADFPRQGCSPRATRTTRVFGICPPFKDPSLSRPVPNPSVPIRNFSTAVHHGPGSWPGPRPNAMYHALMEAMPVIYTLPRGRGRRCTVPRPRQQAAPLQPSSTRQCSGGRDESASHATVELRACVYLPWVREQGGRQTYPAGRRLAAP